MTEVSFQFGSIISVRYFPVCDCRHLFYDYCIIQPTWSPEDLHLCAVYKQTYRQLQTEIDGLCQFLFRENTLRRSGIFTFALNGNRERERKLAKNRDIRETCAEDPAVSLHIPDHKCERCAQKQGWTGTVIGWVTYDTCGKHNRMEY